MILESFTLIILEVDADIPKKWEEKIRSEFWNKR